MDDRNLLIAQRFDFVRKIFILGDEFDFSITSWKRTLKRNIMVGSKFPGTSKHLIWLAMDIVLDDITKKDSFLKRVKELGLHYIDEYLTGKMHVHIQR